MAPSKGCRTFCAPIGRAFGLWDFLAVPKLLEWICTSTYMCVLSVAERLYYMYWNKFAHPLTRVLSVSERRPWRSISTVLVRRTAALLPSDPQNVERSKHRIVLYTRHHWVSPADRKFGLVRKNIQQRWRILVTATLSRSASLSKDSRSSSLWEAGCGSPDCPFSLQYTC